MSQNSGDRLLPRPPLGERKVTQPLREPCRDAHPNQDFRWTCPVCHQATHGAVHTSRTKKPPHTRGKQINILQQNPQVRTVQGRQEQGQERPEKLLIGQHKPESLGWALCEDSGKHITAFAVSQF